MTRSILPFDWRRYQNQNDIQFNLDYSIMRNLQLNMIDYQLIEQNSKSYYPDLAGDWKCKSAIW